MIANYSLNNQTESISLDDEICSSELMSSFPNVSDCSKKKKEEKDMNGGRRSLWKRVLKMVLIEKSF